MLPRGGGGAHGGPRHGEPGVRGGDRGPQLVDAGFCGAIVEGDGVARRSRRGKVQVHEAAESVILAHGVQVTGSGEGAVFHEPYPVGDV